MAQQQEPIILEEEDYYDIIVMGMSGQGKSTTADKLVIANPTGKDYSTVQSEEVPDVSDSGQMRLEDISMWSLFEEQEVASRRLRSLMFIRKSEKPHEQVNDTRKYDPTTDGATKECEVMSNDTSRVRVMDIPGFFGGGSVKSGTLSPGVNAARVNDNNLGIMRKVLHVQTTLGMKFRRILYFLPARGPLERANAIFELDLQLMAHYFGKWILQCMIVVATVRPHASQKPGDDSEKFSKQEIKQTKHIFKKALDEVFPQGAPEEDVQVPPIIFISLTDSCEAILKKVKEAPVMRDAPLQLEFGCGVCADCGVKIGKVNGEETVCTFGEDMSTAIPYKESTCHTVLIPRHSHLDRIVGGVVYVLTFGWARGKNWSMFEEVCASCWNDPGTPGCMQVGKRFKPHSSSAIIVDHTYRVAAVVIEEGTSTGAEGEQ